MILPIIDYFFLYKDPFSYPYLRGIDNLLIAHTNNI